MLRARIQADCAFPVVTPDAVALNGVYRGVHLRTRDGLYMVERVLRDEVILAPQTGAPLVWARSTIARLIETGTWQVRSPACPFPDYSMLAHDELSQATGLSDFLLLVEAEPLVNRSPDFWGSADRLIASGAVRFRSVLAPTDERPSASLLLEPNGLLHILQGPRIDYRSLLTTDGSLDDIAHQLGNADLAGRLLAEPEDDLGCRRLWLSPEEESEVADATR